jgi:hypothetical protein
MPIVVIVAVDDDDDADEMDGVDDGSEATTAGES